MDTRSITITVNTDDERRWATLSRLANLTSIEKWMLVGGQMVGLHAELLGVTWPRVTQDLDIAVNVRVFTREAMREISNAILDLGFEALISAEGVVRFSKGSDVIDLVAPEGIGGEGVLAVGKAKAIQAPGISQAFTRTEIVKVRWQTGEVSIQIPNLFAAIIAKASAVSEIVSQSQYDKLRHQQDLLFLLSLAEQMHNDFDYSGITSRDKTRLRAAALPLLDDSRHLAWQSIESTRPIAELLNDMFS